MICYLFAVRTSKLRDDNLCQRGVGIRNIYRILKTLFIIPHFNSSLLPMAMARSPIPTFSDIFSPNPP